MKYPYIGINKAGTRTLFFSRVNQVVLSAGGGSSLLVGHNYNSIIPEFYENITHEYLQNTYGEVQSPEHAEFIIELAELHGFSVWGRGHVGNVLLSHFIIYKGELQLHSHDCAQVVKSCNLKKITIPLPPKVDKQELNEWPQVGDEVIVKNLNNELRGELLARTREYAIIQNGNYEQHIHLDGWHFAKLKTPEEELRDDIIWLTIKHMENKSYPIENNAYYLFSDLMGKYNITKKV